ncbi:MAG: 4-hydroxybenzoate octaprenyltransferase [Alphaproteobacteria bacterium]|nr:4-hydroxybenzoate octaprenyltransferase [Alphaproteobacteria bacterium]
MPSDINPARMIFRKVPASWHPYIKLSRIDRPIGIWLLLFPCWWSIVLAGGGITNLSPEMWENMALFAAGAFLMRAVGCIINDLWDRHLDANVERTKTRPLASGEISVSQALRFLAVLLFLSLMILIMLPSLTIILGAFSLFLVVIYPKMKKLTWWPQLFLGFVFNWGILMGWSAMTGKLSWECLLLYTGGIFWTLGYDTIYAHQDKKDDALVGIKSTARLFGKKSRIYVSVFYGLSLFFLMTAKYAVSGSFLTPMLIALPAMQVVWQIRTWDINNPKSCLRIFKSNQIYGWLTLLMLAV